MPIVTCDFETAYSKDYSLSKMSTAEYILSPHFEIIGCAVKEGSGPSTWHVGEAAVRNRMNRIDWTKNAMLAHNNRFDGSILAWRLGITPRLYLDTLGMARAMTHAVIGSSSLASLAKYLGLGAKGNEVVLAMGKWLRDFSQSELDNYGSYCCNDNDLCHAIFNRMMGKGFPTSELEVIDLALRAFIIPQVGLDEMVLHQHLQDVRAEKERVYGTVSHIGREVFSSNQQFAALLTSHGCDVPMKPSPATGNLVPALARGDRGFKELLDDDTQTPMIQALLAARINAKSTIEETRTEKTLATARAVWPDGRRGLLPVPLRYYGAHTGRFSGDDGYNWQNVKRASRIKKAVEAPPGKVLVARDSSQIEARMLATIAGQWDLVKAFATGVDVYAQFATKIYGREIIRKRDPAEGFVGKTGILGLGYGCGHEKFQHMLFIGQGGMSLKVDKETAATIVNTYRRSYTAITALWRQAGDVLTGMVVETRGLQHGRRLPAAALPRALGPVEVRHDTLWLPNGMPISYHGLRSMVLPDASVELIYGPENRPWKRIYGPKMVENVTQALARIVITDIMRRVWKSSRIAPVLQVHDSLIYCVDREIAVEFDAYLDQEFAYRPPWAKDLPLASEGTFGQTLLEAEGKE